MKKLLTLLIGLMLLMPSALAGGPTSEPFTVYIKFNGAPVENLNVDFTCNGMTVTQITNNLGGVLVNVGTYGHFKRVGGCSILEVDCGYESCQETFNVNNLDCPMECINIYELSEAPPEPEPECTVDLDCATGYECVSEECVYVEPEPEPIVEDKVSSNADNTIASIESNFGDCIEVVITDNKLTKLFDGIIDFDTEDYDTHEEIRLKACSETSLDDEEYGLVPYVLIEEGGVEYRYVSDDVISFTKDDDEELEISFLGEEIEIISLSSTKMIIRHGEMFDDEVCIEGKEIMYEGSALRIISINEDSIYVSYNGESEQIKREDIDEVGGIEIYVDEAIKREDEPNICSIRIAKDIEETIDDGYEYNDDWEYSIGEGYIGVRNRHDFKYLDEATKPLTLGDKIVFPNDFATIKVNEITESETTEIDIKIRDVYLNVKGDREDEQDDAFSYLNQDYDELYVGEEGILDEDKVFISNKVRIGESDVYLEKGSIIIGDLVIELGFMGISFKGISFDTKEDDYLTYEGIIFKNPEKSVNDESTFKIIVPDEIPKMTITIGAESETIGIEPEPEECPEVTDCKDTVCEPKACTPVPCSPVPCTPVEDCPEQDCPEDGDLVGRIITGILSALGGAGIFFKLFNSKIFTSSNTGMKTYRGRDGDLKLHHKHPGTRGYHDPDISHRSPETHPKGAVDVANHYQKNSKGEWEYR